MTQIVGKDASGNKPYFSSKIGQKTARLSLQVDPARDKIKKVLKMEKLPIPGLKLLLGGNFFDL